MITIVNHHLYYFRENMKIWRYILYITIKPKQYQDIIYKLNHPALHGAINSCHDLLRDIEHYTLDPKIAIVNDKKKTTRMFCWLYIFDGWIIEKNTWQHQQQTFSCNHSFMNKSEPFTVGGLSFSFKACRKWVNVSSIIRHLTSKSSNFHSCIQMIQRI